MDAWLVFGTIQLALTFAVCPLQPSLSGTFAAIKLDPGA